MSSPPPSPRQGVLLLIGAAPLPGPALVLYEELSGDQYALEGLTIDGWSDGERNIDTTWLRGIARSERLNLWRLRLYGISVSDGWIKQRIKADYILALKGNQGSLRDDVGLFVAEQKAVGFSDAPRSATARPLMAITAASRHAPWLLSTTWPGSTTGMTGPG